MALTRCRAPFNRPVFIAIVATFGILYLCGLLMPASCLPTPSARFFLYSHRCRRQVYRQILELDTTRRRTQVSYQNHAYYFARENLWSAIQQSVALTSRFRHTPRRDAHQIRRDLFRQRCLYYQKLRQVPTANQ